MYDYIYVGKQVRPVGPLANKMCRNKLNNSFDVMVKVVQGVKGAK